MVLKYYADMNEAPVFNPLIKSSINIENQFMAFSDSSWQYFPYTGSSTGAYIIIDQGGPIENGTHILEPFSQSSAESEYNAECTAGMALSHFRILIHELLNKEPDIVTE